MTGPSASPHAGSSAGSQLSPHHAQPITLTGRYGPVAALHAATPQPRATVLLLPGYTGSKEDFAPLLDGCAAAGFDTVAVDLPGQFESPGPVTAAAYHPEPLGEVVAELLAGLAMDGRPSLLLGHSYGGLVARAAVLAGAKVDGLTLMDSGPGKLPDGPRREALDLGETLLRESGTAAAYRVREAWSARHPAWASVSQQLRDFLRERFIASNSAGLLGMAAGLREEPDRVMELAAVLNAAEVPRLVVAGAGDDAWSVAEQQDMARRLDAPFAAIPNAAHSPNTENPAGLLDVLLPAWTGWLPETV